MTIQENWDDVFSKLGRSAPAQRADESNIDYERRLASLGQRYIPAGEDVAKIDFAKLPDDVVGKFSSMTQDALTRNLFRTDNMQPGELREVYTKDPNSSQVIRNFVGPDSFVKAMGLPGRRVVKINAPEQRTLYSNRREAASTWF